MSKSYEIDMVHGPLFGKILMFSVPLMLSGILQLLFNAADTIVVGRFAGSTALAAVGSNGALINLLVNLFIGLSVGANVLVARYYGAGREDEVSDTVHTAITLSAISGIILLVVGFFVTRILLIWMGTPDDVLDLASLYLKIYFLGMPAMLLYNFGSSILRAIGDTKRPLYYLTISGVVNVILNLIFVILCHMSVAGVALATIISQAISAFLVIRCLMKTEGACHLDFHRLGIHKVRVKQIMQIGLPAGLQSTIFSLSNVLIQSSVNSFGSIAMAGNTSSANIEGFIFVAMNSFQQTAMSFTSQNYGAGKEKRIHKVLILCLAMVVTVGLVLGIAVRAAGTFLLGIYSPDPEVVRYGLMRMSVIAVTYFLCGIMDTTVGALRGIGYSLLPMIVSLIGACALRVVWIFTIFQWHRSLTTLYISYPISWILTASVQLTCYVLIRRKQLKNK